MQDPTSVKFLRTQALHRSGQMTGHDRPVGRVTWAKGALHGVTSGKPGMGVVRYLDKTAPETEFMGIRTIEIQRSIGTDAATCTITMYNVRPDWAAPEGLDTEGSLGYLTPGRGEARPSAVSVFDLLPGSEIGPAITYPTTWEYSSNKFRDVLIPNTVLRTYQGYGSDNFDDYGNQWGPNDSGYVAPQADSQLWMTGVWLIDNVTFDAAGTVTIECRDLAKLLIEQYIYPPMIPIDRFPLIYMPAQDASGHKESLGKNVATFHSSSVDAKYGKNASMNGHRGSDAFDGSWASYWLSGPNAQVNGIEWLQAKVDGDVNEIVLNCAYGNCVVYVSVHANGKWQGSSNVTGTAEDGSNTENLTASEGNGAGGYFYVVTSGDTLWDLAGTYYGDNTLWPIIARANNNIIRDPHWIYPGQKIKIPYVAGTKSPPPANSGTGGTKVVIPYVVKTTVPASGNVTISLPATYKADYVRLVFTNLHQLGTSDYRAGVRTMVARNHLTNTYKPSTIGKAGYIQDWYEPVKEMCAWAGFTYFDVNQTATSPPTFTPDPLLGNSDGSSRWLYQYPSDTRNNPVALRIWGDFEFLGAGPVVATPGDYFMSKSFMEGIRLIADFIGAIVFVDETGGVQFRLPNIWQGGNFIDDPNAPSSVAAYINEYPIEFHEDANVVSYQAVISDEALRSEVLVIGNWPGVTAKGIVAGGTVLGYDPVTNTTSAVDFTNLLGGQYRLMIVPGDSTKLFFTEEECQRMAEMVGLFILFTYRQGTLTAPAHPALQLDDQIRIFERVTSESYVHYVSSIHTTQDLEAGSYTMDVTTHWLGTDPNTEWFTNKALLTPAVKELPAILARVGKQAPGDGDLQTLPYGT